jgi:ABC-type multidrug transport system ATPase subunit
LKNLQQKGITILVSTPYMDEAALCDRIALIQNGKILKTDTPEHIAKDFPYDLYNVRADNMYQLLLDLKDFSKTHSVYPFGEFLHFAPNDDTFNINELKEYLNTKNHQNIIIETEKPGIEDIFMELTG